MTGSPQSAELAADRVPLDGITLVEASAGTGKTHAVTDLYLRLVLEQRRTVDQILVVTYTKAATAELRGRIRRRLADALALTRAPDADPDGAGPDPYLLALVQGAARRDRDAGAAPAARRLRSAVQGFDEAPIYTIHGFCQRALMDAAFEGGQPFARELVTDDYDILSEAVRDFWRREVGAASQLWSAYLMDRKLGPVPLTEWLHRCKGRPYLRVDRSAEGASSEDAESGFLDAHAAAREAWRAMGADFATTLTGTTSLNRNTHNPDRVRDWLAALDGFLGQPEPGAGAAPLPDGPVRKALDKLTSPALAAGTRKGLAPVSHPFAGWCEALRDAWSELERAFGARHLELLARLLTSVEETLRRRSRELRIHTYDDLLVELAEALHGRGGASLSAALAARFPCALIDEFQDTDPTQLDIFSTIYHGREGVSVFLVGDPKQAIYGFRGADVFAYLDGRERAQRQLGLSVNRRSRAGLVRAVNRLFETRETPFVFPQIEFQPAGSAEPAESLTIEDEVGAPLRVWWLPPPGDRDRLNKAEARALAATGTASEVVRLLAAAGRGRATLGCRPLDGGDIAVLVRTNDQGAAVQEALSKLGVPSVRPAQDNVLESTEATEVEAFLRAVVHPHREPLIRTALTSSLIGLDGRALHDLSDNPADWDLWLDRFHQWRGLWRRGGFSRMYRDVLETQAVRARVLGRDRGERQLTNLLHLGELLTRVELEEHANPEQLLRWLSRPDTPAGIASEDTEQRLESDSSLVRILTVHGSKGLQFPVVFCPFAWDGRRSTSPTPIYHDPRDGYRPAMDLSGRDDRLPAQSLASEGLSEDVRLLYVALTRARHRCYLALGPVSGVEHSAVGWLLGAGAALEAGLASWAERAGEDLSRDALPDAGARAVPPPRGQPALAPRVFRGDLSRRWAVTSFTGLTSDLPAELPDHDRVAGASEDPDGVTEGSAFPRGARAGTCLHAILERIDFTVEPALQRELLTGTLTEHGFGEEHLPAALGLVDRARLTPLDPEGRIRLAGVGAAARVSELEFYFPLGGARLDALVRRAQRAGYLRGEESTGTEWQRGVTGFLKGYVDLVFAHGGRYFLVDYKSHWLGPGPASYSPRALDALVDRDRYALQYLLYLVAVNRYLSTRVPGYRYETHLGGVFYLFLRGMEPGRAASGVYANRPDPDLIRDLDGLLAGALAAPGAAPLQHELRI